MTRRRCCPRWKPRACGSSEAQFATHSPETGAIDSTSTSQSQMLSAGLGAPRRRSAHRRSRSAPTSTSGESRWATVRSTSGISRMMISTAICDAVISQSTRWPFHWISFAWVRFRIRWSIPSEDADDIAERRLRLVTDGALRDDPLRLLRAVRLESEHGWRPDAELRSAMRRDAALISRSAAERQWDELQRILVSDHLPWALRRMEQSGLLDAIFPELALCRAVEQRPVHRRDVFWHQLDAVRWLTRLSGVTGRSIPRSRRASAIRNELQPLLDVPSVAARLDEWRLPLRLATLLHDIGKPQTRTVDADGSTHFFGHSELGAEMAQHRLRVLRAPARTVEQIELLIEQHLRPGQVNSPGKPPSDRALHRFHLALGDAATPLCWLFLADSLATAGADVLLPRWRGYAAHVARIIAWQPRRPQETGRILDGNAIMHATGLEPGPLVGQIRAKIDEAAAVGEITDAEEAREMARRLAGELSPTAGH